jgi:hypothetical protein
MTRTIRATPTIRTIRSCRGRLFWVLALLAGCGGRAPFWSSPIATPPPTFNLGDQIAVVDTGADRVVLLTAGANQSLTTTAIPVGVNILNAATSPDGKTLFVVSGGHRAQLGDDQPSEWPSITVITSGAQSARYDLENITDPLAGLAIDPAGHWVVLYPGSGTNQPFVENPNELVILDVSQSPDTAVAISHTLMSFGGHGTDGQRCRPNESSDEQGTLHENSQLKAVSLTGCRCRSCRGQSASADCRPKVHESAERSAFSSVPSGVQSRPPPRATRAPLPPSATSAPPD